MRDPKQALDRRTVMAGVGTVGALAAAATLLPAGEPSAPTAPDAGAKPSPDTAAGYRLTEHVKRYYATARI
jgi:hypothetical protein